MLPQYLIFLDFSFLYADQKIKIHSAEQLAAPILLLSDQHWTRPRAGVRPGVPGLTSAEGPPAGGGGWAGQPHLTSHSGWAAESLSPWHHIRTGLFLMTEKTGP